MADVVNLPHRRYNPLTAEWVLVSPQRTQRPWLGASEAPRNDSLPAYDPQCYLCPGNKRASGDLNPDYTDVYVFDNDFPALLPDAPVDSNQTTPLLRTQRVKGTNRVLCFSPRHDVTLAEMAIDDITLVVDAWVNQTSELGKTYEWVQVFENKGSMMGCSNPHPHCQIWATDFLPNEPMKEDRAQKRHLNETGDNLLLAYLANENERSERIVFQNDSWAALVPFWAVWPFETLVLPKRHIPRMTDLSSQERQDLAGILKQLLEAYDNLFCVSFPYSMGWHGAPFNQENQDHWQLHAHFYPPLLRSATVRKFIVGYEMLAEAQRDITAEQAADRLRQVGE